MNKCRAVNSFKIDTNILLLFYLIVTFYSQNGYKIWFSPTVIPSEWKSV